MLMLIYCKQDKSHRRSPGMEPANITSDGTLAIDMYTVATPSRPRAAEGWRSAGSSGPGAADGAAARVGVPIVAVPLRPGKQ
jgi:hypothetical protein